ncbi:MAG: helix-turn-helix transcriptional regulator [Spirochaetes bacterium]|nr:helix-turn-helix transcriptional regulator [Spirochaetota bacterium]
MSFIIKKPTPILSQYIKYYWILEISQSSNYSDPCEIIPQNYCDLCRVIPNGMAELIIHFGDDYYCIDETGNLVKEPAIAICGQKNRYFDLITPKIVHFLSVVFKPAGVAAFFPFSLHEVVNNSIELEAVFPEDRNRLAYQIAEQKSANQKVAIVENFLINKLKPQKRKHLPLMEKIFFQINKNPGKIDVDTICQNFDLNSRFLERRFKEYIGINPKSYLRIVRLQNAIHRFSCLKTTLTDLSYDAGYYDQAHFIREVKALTGLTPKEFFHQPVLYSDYFL